MQVFVLENVTDETYLMSESIDLSGV